MLGRQRARWGAAILMLAAAGPWAFCSACMIYQPRVSRPPTLGQELIELDRARKDGLLTDAEYSERRALIIAAWKDIGAQPIEQIDAYADSPRPAAPSSEGDR